MGTVTFPRRNTSTESSEPTGGMQASASSLRQLSCASAARPVHHASVVLVYVQEETSCVRLSNEPNIPIHPRLLTRKMMALDKAHRFWSGIVAVRDLKPPKED
jgi:hypothetical protein